MFIIFIKKIEANYNGSTKAGTKIDEECGDLIVTAVYENGEKEELSHYVDEWTIRKPITLKAGKTSTIKILYEDTSCDLKIKCSTLPETQYKEKFKVEGEHFNFSMKEFIEYYNDYWRDYNCSIEDENTYVNDLKFWVYTGIEDGSSNNEVAFLTNDDAKVKYIAITGNDAKEIAGNCLRIINKDLDINEAFNNLYGNTWVELEKENIVLTVALNSGVINIMTLDYWNNN